MAKRGFHAMPEHEDRWEVPVSQVPAAYNLQARMQAAADKGRQGEAAEAPLSDADEDSSGALSKQPRKPRQQVHMQEVALQDCAPCSDASCCSGATSPAEQALTPPCSTAQVNSCVLPMIQQYSTAAAAATLQVELTKCCSCI